MKASVGGAAEANAETISSLLQQAKEAAKRREEAKQNKATAERREAANKLREAAKTKIALRKHRKRTGRPQHTALVCHTGQRVVVTKPDHTAARGFLLRITPKHLILGRGSNKLVYVDRRKAVTVHLASHHAAAPCNLQSTTSSKTISGASRRRGPGGFEQPPSKKIDSVDSIQWRWDTIAAGVSIGGFGLNLHLGTLTWRHFRLTLVDVGLAVGVESGGPGSLDWHVGALVGFGGHTGKGLRSSHWFVMGLWYGDRRGVSGWNTNTEGSYKGLFLPFGYEHRQRWGSNGQKVAGIRMIVAYSPVGRSEGWSEWTYEGGSLRDMGSGYREYTPVSKKLERWMFGFTLFVGI